MLSEDGLSIAAKGCGRVVKVKGFAIDIDGTLTNGFGELELEGVHGIRWMARIGYPVVFVSARPVWEVWSLAKLVGVTRTVVAENGGVVATSPVDLHQLGDKSIALEALDLLSKRINSVVQFKSSPRLATVALERTFEIREGRQILEEAGSAASISDTGFTFVLAQRGVDKGRGLAKATEILGLDIMSLVAIGDGENDLPLFSACGYSIALGQAPAPVKEAARFVASHKYGDGLVEGLKHVVDTFMKAKVEHH